MDKNLKTLATAYAWAVVLLVLTTIDDFDTSIRAVILLIGYLPVSIVHLKISIGSLGGKARKLSMILSLLWILQIAVVILSEGLTFFYGMQSLLAEVIDLIVFMAIAVIVFISCLLNMPFFCAKTESKTVVVAGILGLLCTISVGVMVSLALVDLYSGHWSVVTPTLKPR